MGKHFLLGLFGLGYVVLGFTQQRGSYRFDQDKSEVLFKVRHLGLLEVKGHFNTFMGHLIFSNNILESGHCSIDAGSIDTNDVTRDETLRSDAYFDVATFPSIVFKSQRSYWKDQILRVDGLLKIRGIEKSFTIPFHLDTIGEKENSVYLSASVALDRADFGLDFGAMDALIGKTVWIRLSLTAFRN